MPRQTFATASSQAAAAVVAIVISAGYASGESPYAVSWARQLGTAVNDVAYAIAADDAGNSYVAGYSSGSLGSNSTLSGDIVVAKYDAEGGLVWLNQIARSIRHEEAHAIALDSEGNIFISGVGVLNSPSFGMQDVFLAKLSPNGGTLWSRTLGTPNSDRGYSVAIDAEGNAFVSGVTSGSLAEPNHGGSDPFVAKYSSEGTHLWSRQPGTADDDGTAYVGVDGGGNVYLAGWTWGSVDGVDFDSIDEYLIKYDPAGNHVWSRQIGTNGYDEVFGIAVDVAGNSFVAGGTSYSGTLAKHDSFGNVLWTRHFGENETMATSVALDAAGNSYVTGWTSGLEGAASTGRDDAFLIKFNPDGNQLWARPFGSYANDIGWGVAIGGRGAVYIAGETRGVIEGIYRGQRDLFVAKFVPEPGAGFLMAFGIALLVRRRRFKASGDLRKSDEFHPR